ncbi:hypothetical protein HK102_000409, partial [Quaeritorhiza haematococci]
MPEPTPAQQEPTILFEGNPRPRVDSLAKPPESVDFEVAPDVVTDPLRAQLPAQFSSTHPEFRRRPGKLMHVDTSDLYGGGTGEGLEQLLPRKESAAEEEEQADIHPEDLEILAALKAEALRLVSIEEQRHPEYLDHIRNDTPAAKALDAFHNYAHAVSIERNIPLEKVERSVPATPSLSEQLPTRHEGGGVGQGSSSADSKPRRPPLLGEELTQRLMREASKRVHEDREQHGGTLE